MQSFEVHYAYPTSTFAEDLNRGREGCFFIALIEYTDSECPKPPAIHCGPYETRQQAEAILADINAQCRQVALERRIALESLDAQFPQA